MLKFGGNCLLCSAVQVSGTGLSGISTVHYMENSVFTRFIPVFDREAAMAKKKDRLCFNSVTFSLHLDSPC